MSWTTHSICCGLLAEATIHLHDLRSLDALNLEAHHKTSPSCSCRRLLQSHHHPKVGTKNPEEQINSVHQAELSGLCRPTGDCRRFKYCNLIIFLLWHNIYKHRIRIGSVVTVCKVRQKWQFMSEVWTDMDRKKDWTVSKSESSSMVRT